MRAKILEISGAIQATKWTWMALFRKALPTDAKITGFRVTDNMNLELRVESDTFDSVHPSTLLPTIYASINFEDVEAEKGIPSVSPYARRKDPPKSPDANIKIWDKCYCELEYTGERLHRAQCPRATRR